MHIYIWVNYQNSLYWIKAIWGCFPLLTMISSEGEQWGRYNLPRFIYIYIYCLTLSPVLSGWSVVDPITLPGWFFTISVRSAAPGNGIWLFFWKHETQKAEKCNIDPAEVCTVYINYKKYIYIHIDICHLSWDTEIPKLMIISLDWHKDSHKIDHILNIRLGIT